MFTRLTINHDGVEKRISGEGNGRLDSVSNAFKDYFNLEYTLKVYEEHAVSIGSASKAASYVGIEHNGRMFWGVGINQDIIKSSVSALVSAVNKIL